MGRLRGWLWLAAGLIVAFLAALAAFNFLSNAGQTAPVGGRQAPSALVPVVVADRAVIVRSALVTDDLTLKELPVEALPQGAVRQIKDAVGKISVVDLYPGEVVLTQRLVDPNEVAADGRLALVLAEDQVLMAFPAKDLMSQAGILKPGDHVDILFSLDFPSTRQVAAAPVGGETAAAAAVVGPQEKEQATINLLQNITVAAVVASRTQAQGTTQQQNAAAPEAILLTVNPQDALVLKYAKDAGGIPDIVLRPPGVERPYTVGPVDVDYMITRYQIPNAARR